MKDSLRFLATGDFHSDVSLVSLIKDSVDLSTIDYILFIGDLSDTKQDYDKLLSIFGEIPILFVPGNHEISEELPFLSQEFNLHVLGDSPLIFPQLDLAILGSNILGIGPYGVGEDEVFFDLIEEYEKVKHISNKLLLYHLPPSDSQLSEMSPFYPFIGGSLGLRYFLSQAKIDLVLCGHIHESSGLSEEVDGSQVVNVGRTFKIIEFDNIEKKISFF